MENIEEKLKKVKIIVSDVDGVLTDGKVYLWGREEEMKVFFSKDEPRVVMARNSGLQVLLVTGRECEAVVRRAREMDVDLMFKRELKGTKFLDILKEKYGVEPNQIAYIGDDWSDVYLMGQAGVAITPYDGSNENKAMAHIITEAKGGEGVMAEAVEKIMRAQGTWEKYLEEELPTTQKGWDKLFKN